MLQPLSGNLFVKFDPQPEKVGSMLVAQEDYITWCNRCGALGSDLDRPCPLTKSIFELDEVHDRQMYRGEDHSHVRERVREPIVPEPVVIAQIITSGHPDFLPGQRYFVQWTSGHPIPDDDPFSPFRVISINAALMLVEEE